MVAEWLACCFLKPVIRRALLSALIVGSILVLINHGDAVLRGQIDGIRLFRIFLTVIVPYVVSTVSSASTMMSVRQEKLILDLNGLEEK
jgi:hypothetical protein